MNEIFDVTNIIFLVIAVVVFLRLRSVLGKRTGNERPPFDPYSAPSQNDETKQSHGKSSDNVIQLPGTQEVNTRSEQEMREQVEAEIDKLAKDTPVNNGLREILREEPNFNPKDFVNGARAAYEMIVVAFAEGDRKTLKNLLSDEVYEGFVGAINTRESNGERVESTFIGIDKADIIEAVMKGKSALITMRLKSQLITVTRNKENEVVDGDPTTVTDVTDIWTFARETGAPDPNWKLVGTEAVE